MSDITRKILAAAAALTVATVGLPKVLAAEPANGAGASTHYLQGKSHNASVTVDSGHREVTVKVKPATKDHPSSVRLTFWDEDSRPLTLELKAVPGADATDPDAFTYAGPMPSALRAPGSANLSPNNQSYVGLELSIPLSKGGSDTLRVRGD